MMVTIYFSVLSCCIYDQNRKKHAIMWDVMSSLAEQFELSSGVSNKIKMWIWKEENDM